MAIIELIDVNKKFGKKQVLLDVNLKIEQSGVYGLIGSNGCGKTTTMKLILGLLRKNSGSIFVYDRKVTFGNTPTNKYIGYLPDVPQFYNYMNAVEYLTFCARSLKIPRNEYKTRIETLINLVGLQSELKTHISGYSRGMKQRLGIAQALLSNPKILICDEPTSALDPQGRKDILNIIKKVGKKITVIFSTHILSDVEQVCDYVAIMKNSQISEFSTIKKLKQKYYKNQFVISFNTEDELLVFKNITNWKNTFIKDQTNLVVTDDNINSKYKQSFAIIAHDSIDIVGIYKVEPSLEDIFLEEVHNV